MIWDPKAGHTDSESISVEPGYTSSGAGRDEEMLAKHVMENISPSFEQVKDTDGGIGPKVESVSSGLKSNSEFVTEEKFRGSNSSKRGDV